MFGSRHNISELSSAFSTGNSGATFEHNIQAVFLLTLLVDGFSPILEAPIDCIELQAKHLGYAIDDFVVVAANGAKLLCQVKHKDAKLVWGRLVEYCGSQNFRASTLVFLKR